MATAITPTLTRRDRDVTASFINNSLPVSDDRRDTDTDSKTSFTMGDIVYKNKRTEPSTTKVVYDTYGATTVSPTRSRSNNDGTTLILHIL